MILTDMVVVLFLFLGRLDCLNRIDPHQYLLCLQRRWHLVRFEPCLSSSAGRVWPIALGVASSLRSKFSIRSAELDTFCRYRICISAIWHDDFSTFVVAPVQENWVHIGENHDDQR